VPSEDNRPAEVATAVPRLVDVSLEMVISSRNSALANAVARVVREAERGEESFAAHGSSPVQADELWNTTEQQGVGKS
jgi:FXSXX-COOH protein